MCDCTTNHPYEFSFPDTASTYNIFVTHITTLDTGYLKTVLQVQHSGLNQQRR